MTGAELLFWIFASLSAGGAVAVVITQNIVRMAFWLMVSLGSVAGLFFLLHADFVAATQLLIYVGGTVVLLIFGVMLTASGPYVRIKTSPAEAFLSAGVGLLFLAMIVATVTAVDWPAVADVAPEGYNPPAQGNTARPIGLAFLSVRPDTDLEKPADATLGTGYLLPFEIISVHLLVVLIGAAYLARAKRRVTRGPE
ncbi:MAG: NADH-quinone oxidoreductase subunit J family protein [Planctomycetaceae bacterium]